jgi:HlyD family secretion protein
LPGKHISTPQGNYSVSLTEQQNEHHTSTRTNRSKNAGEAEIDEVVFVHQNGKIRKVKVKTVIQDMNHIRILEGIKVNDEVVSAPYTAISKLLRDSMDVVVVDAGSLYMKTE